MDEFTATSPGFGERSFRKEKEMWILESTECFVSKFYCVTRSKPFNLAKLHQIRADLRCF